MYQLDATIYYDFILINSLYVFRTFTCPSSGVLIYRLFTALQCHEFSNKLKFLSTFFSIICPSIQNVSENLPSDIGIGLIIVLCSYRAY